MQIKYEKSKIFKLVSKKTKKIYIGSTQSKYLSGKLAHMKEEYKKWIKNRKSNNKKEYFKLFERGDVKIYLIEDYPCNNIHELRCRVRYWIDKYRAKFSKKKSN